MEETCDLPTYDQFEEDLIQMDDEEDDRSNEEGNEEGHDGCFAPSQTLEIIPEVDEGDNSGNDEYIRDMALVRKLLRKYKKKPTSKRHKDLQQKELPQQQLEPFVEIENINSVIMFKEASDPDSWFERHANLIQNKPKNEKETRHNSSDKGFGRSNASDLPKKHPVVVGKISKDRLMQWEKKK
jgi:hypothetical protein